MPPDKLFADAHNRCMSRFIEISHAVVLIACLTVSGFGQSTDDDDVAFFEQKIRPVLAGRCYECHAGDVAESGLRLDSRDGLRTGGDRGPALIAGKPGESLLLTAISHSDGDLKMPPRGAKLAEAVLADFRKWIETGAVDPRTTPDRSTPLRRVSAESFWAYQTLKKTSVPQVRSGWVKSDIDRFVLTKLDEKKLRPRTDATRVVLLRRLFFDLIGLPPSPKDVTNFIAADKEFGLDRALETVVNRLLEMPQFGERWGRHWLDVARFAESSGKEANISFPYAWRYRDYVIDALNADVPFDRFIVEQLAGDLLPYENDKERTRLLIATGFLALGPKRSQHDFFQGKTNRGTQIFLHSTFQQCLSTSTISPFNSQTQSHCGQHTGPQPLLQPTSLVTHPALHDAQSPAKVTLDASIMTLSASIAVSFRTIVNSQ